MRITGKFLSLYSFLAAIAISILIAQAAPAHSDGDSEALLSKLQHTEDIGHLNLLCGSGLPGTDILTVDEGLKRLETWTAHIKKETERNLYRFRRKPSDYESSESFFRALMLVTVLEQDFGVKYNMELVKSGVMQDMNSTAFFKDGSNLFLQGLLSDRRSGSCSSMPVLVASIGRHLGYPLKLVRAKGHLFVRWDDKKERFNMDNAGNGLVSKPDEHYRRWPHPITDAEIDAGLYLRSMTRGQELASFLETRAACLLEAGRAEEAIEALEKALELWPELRECRLLLGRAKQMKVLQEG